MGAKALAELLKVRSGPQRMTSHLFSSTSSYACCTARYRWLQLQLDFRAAAPVAASNSHQQLWEQQAPQALFPAIPVTAHCCCLGCCEQVNTTLEVLELNGNVIDYEGVSALAEALTANSSLKSLGLGDNYLGPLGAGVSGPRHCQA